MAVSLRRIPPYPFEFAVTVKGRWIGRTLLEMFTTDFPYYDGAYYQRKIEQGWITINAKQVCSSTILKNGDRVEHLLHRHEQPVLEVPIEVVEKSESWIIINKPPSMPVHPCGRYRKNTVLYAMAEIGFTPLWPVHRLDRLTSGLLLFGRTSSNAAMISKQISDAEEAMNESSSASALRSFRKVYLARVKGHFQPERQECSMPIHCVDKRVGIYGCCTTDPSSATLSSNATSTVKVSEGRNGHPKDDEESSSRGEVIGIQDSDGEPRPKKPKQSNNAESKEEKRMLNRARCAPVPDDAIVPKRALTKFQLLFYDSDTDESVVVCHPKTGRTHQIRLHLRHLGYPIANDPNYGPIGPHQRPPTHLVESATFSKAPNLESTQNERKGRCSDEDCCGFCCYESTENGLLESANTPTTLSSGSADTTIRKRRWAPTAHSCQSVQRMIAECPECRQETKQSCTDGSEEEGDGFSGALFIYLHAYALAIELDGQKRSFKTSVPWWAIAPKETLPSFSLDQSVLDSG